MGRLTLNQRQHSQPSPATAAAVAALLPPMAAAEAAAAGRLGPQGRLRVQTPTVAALAASQGMDVSEVALVQPSPMAAEATVAALSALMQQPARQPASATAKRAASAEKGKQLLSFGDELEEEGEWRVFGRVGGDVQKAVRVYPAALAPSSFDSHACLHPSMCVPHLSSCAEGSEGVPGSARTRAAMGLSVATAKRFKHEKTLVMLNPLLGGALLESLGGWLKCVLLEC